MPRPERGAGRCCSLRPLVGVRGTALVRRSFLLRCPFHLLRDLLAMPVIESKLLAENSRVASSWYVKLGNGSEFGPISDSELRDLLGRNTVRLGCLLRRDDQADWKTVDGEIQATSEGNRHSECVIAELPIDASSEPKSITEHTGQPVRVEAISEVEGLAVIQRSPRPRPQQITSRTLPEIAGIALVVVPSVLVLLAGVSLLLSIDQQDGIGGQVKAFLRRPMAGKLFLAILAGLIALGGILGKMMFESAATKENR